VVGGARLRGGHHHAGRPSTPVDAAVELHQEWSALGRPDRDRLGLTVTAHRRQYVWLDDPQSGRLWNLAGGAEGTWWQPGPVANAGASGGR
ncbi:MAG: Methyltransferase, ATP-grasp peptide maturase system, partial [Chloroflexi bacterium]|nr:Methyltransferase, ATP-grasp peptide maturase system [Chloroflexota bacterium]